MGSNLNETSFKSLILTASVLMSSTEDENAQSLNKTLHKEIALSHEKQSTKD